MNEKLKVIIEAFIDSGFTIDFMLRNMKSDELSNFTRLLFNEVVRVELNKTEGQEKLFEKSRWSKENKNEWVDNASN